MPERVDLYTSYRHFSGSVLDAVRRETFGTDIGGRSQDHRRPQSLQV